MDSTHRKFKDPFRSDLRYCIASLIQRAPASASSTSRDRRLPKTRGETGGKEYKQAHGMTTKHHSPCSPPRRKPRRSGAPGAGCPTHSRWPAPASIAATVRLQHPGPGDTHPNQTLQRATPGLDRSRVTGNVRLRQELVRIGSQFFINYFREHNNRPYS